MLLSNTSILLAVASSQLTSRENTSEQASVKKNRNGITHQILADVCVFFFKRFTSGLNSDKDRYTSHDTEFSLEERLSLLIASDGAVDERICGTLSVITATFTGPRRKPLFPKAPRPAAPCATHCYPATCQSFSSSSFVHDAGCPHLPHSGLYAFVTPAVFGFKNSSCPH